VQTPPPARTIQRHLLALLEVSGPLTRAELADLAGLPPTTVAGVVKGLLRSRHLDEVVSGPRPHQAGRPARALALAGPYYRLLGNALGNGRWFDAYLCGLVPKSYVPGNVPAAGCQPPKP